MSDQKQHDSVLIGYTDEPRYYEGQLSSWSVKIKEAELREVLEKYITSKNAEGHGGNAYFKLFMSQSGKPCCSVYDENSEGAKAKKAARKAKQEAATDGVPF